MVSKVVPCGLKEMDRKESNMRLLQVIPSYWPATQFGGTVFSSHNLNKVLVKKGIDLTVYTTNVGLEGKVAVDRETIVDGVKVRYFGFSKFFEFLGPTGWQFSAPLRKALEKNIKDFDLVYILSIWNYPVVVAPSICRRFDKPYIVSPRGMLYPETYGRKIVKKRLYYELFAKKNIKKADAIHYTSCDEREKCHNRLGLRNKAIVVPNGIDLAGFENLPGKDELRLKYPVLKGKKVILFLGRISWKKGLDILVKAFNSFSRERKDLHLVIAGGDGAGYRIRVANLIDRLGLQDKVIFTGVLSGREKLQAYAGSDIFVLSSYSENFGMSVIEAMACGLPVVISDKVGIYREVKDRNSGIIVEANTESVYKGIKKLLNDENLRKEIADKGKLFVNEFYDIDKVADKMIEEFGEILKVSR